MSENFYRYQQRRLAILLAWGLANTLGGSLGLLSRDPLWRQFAGQAGAWGAIDAALAFVGRRGARSKELRLAQGELTPADQRREAQRFRVILLVNAGLDLLYIAGGARLARQQRPDRRGIGLDIVVQGAFLLLYDSLLALEVGRRYAGGSEETEKR